MAHRCEFKHKKKGDSEFSSNLSGLLLSNREGPVHDPSQIGLGKSDSTCEPSLGPALRANHLFKSGRPQASSRLHERSLHTRVRLRKYLGTASDRIAHRGVVALNEPSFGKWLGRQLVRRHWSGADLSRQLGTGTSTVSMWLRDVRTPSPASSERIADALGVDRDVVLALTGHRTLDEEVDPDSPAGRIHSLVDRIEWTDEKVIAIEGLLQMYLEADRKKQVRRRDATLNQKP